MLIKEVPKDAELTIEVSVAARKLEFKSQCIDTGMNYLYARPIIIDGKRVSFEASVTLSVSLVYIREDKNPVLWRGVGISTVTENGKSMYKITSSMEGYEMNRRQAYRLFLGLGAVAQIGINKKAVNVIIKDIRIRLEVKMTGLTSEQVQERIDAEVNKRLEITKKESSEAVEKRINTLNLALSKADRIADIIKAAEDHDYQQKLFEEFGL